MKYVDTLILKDFWDDLKSRDIKKIYIPAIIDHMNTIGWRIKNGELVQEKHARNSAKWLQKFLNGDWLELAFINLNSHQADFIETNHGYIKRGSSGNNIPDFNIKATDNNVYTLDTKTYSYVEDSFNNNKNIFVEVGSFHESKFILIFCMKTRRFYWLIKAGNSYTFPCLFKDLPIKAQELLKDIKLPDQVEMLRIEVPSDATDDQLPEYASYTFTVYDVIKD